MLAFLRRRIRRAVAGRTVPGSRLVEENRPGADKPCQLVALGAAYVLVRTTQRKLRSLLVVEKRRLPFHAVVALGTTGYIALGELFPVNILMAVLALGRRRFEVHVQKIGFKIRRFVAIHASRCAVRPQQRKLRLRVIEAG